MSQPCNQDRIRYSKSLGMPSCYLETEIPHRSNFQTESQQSAISGGTVKLTLEESNRWQRLISTLSISIAVTVIVAFSASTFFISSKIDEVTGSIAAIKSDISEIKSDISEIKSDVGVLKTDVAVLKTDVGRLKIDVTALQSGQDQIFEVLRDAKLLPGN